jgi:hypothetical protein
MTLVSFLPRFAVMTAGLLFVGAQAKESVSLIIRFYFFRYGDYFLSRINQDLALFARSLLEDSLPHS